MSTLRTQYKDFLKSNPHSTLTYIEWCKQYPPFISDDFQIGPDGAFEYSDDIEDWDNTLLDGLEEE